ncbi:MAG: SDR family NAD(P)-dependent oxidoreductase, partial [Actinobacteria bacterium]|nr:SDR family NAD(P)-dependent oxidoreductase [Actinomycetota bacterium]
MTRTIVIIGGTSGIGLEIAKDAVARGEHVVLTGRDQTNAEAIAATLGDSATGL